MAGKLDGIVVAKQTNKAQIVGWRFIPFGVAEPAAAKVKVWRSASPDSGFEQIATVPALKGWFFDEDIDLLNRWSVFYYKLDLVVDDIAQGYGPVRLEGTNDKIASGLVKHRNTYLRMAGLPVLVYPYLESGERCSCWDAVLRKSTISNCPTCFGTGYLSGYYPPILTLAQIGVEAKQNLVGERIEQEAAVEVMMSNYPVLRPGDVVYEIDAGRRYRIQSITPSEKGRMLIAQDAVGYALQTSDAEHNIPIPEIDKLEPVLRRNFSPHRLVSSTDGEAFNYSSFDQTRY
jgi:hypothetical protein